MHSLKLAETYSKLCSIFSDTTAKLTPNSFLEVTVVDFMKGVYLKKKIKKKLVWFCCDKYFLSDLEIFTGDSTHTVLKKESGCGL